MDAFIDIMSKFGIAAAAMVALAVFLYKLVNRIMDENKERENKLRDQSDKLIEANNTYSDSLKSVADTIYKSNEVNSNLADTNKLLVDKIDGHLTNIDINIKDVANKLDKWGEHND